MDTGPRFGYTRTAVKKKKTVVTTLRQSLSYEPVELAFGTSGLRGLVKDITNLEAYVNVRGFLSWLLGRGELEKGGRVYAAGDLRPSTSSIVAEEGFRGEILQAACRAVEDSGLVFVNLGKVPTPALVLHAMRHSAPAIMVTGSHIPFDRNGLKLTRPAGEVMKADEEPILAAVAAARRTEYEKHFEDSLFDARGMLRPEHRVDIPAPDPEAAHEYVSRYVSAFPSGALAGKKIMVWEHSAVGRELLARTLAELGAEVVTAGRSDTFVAVDTEAVNEPMLQSLQALVDARGGASLAAVVSTDGDGDRPLFLPVEAGRLRFVPGDLLGLLAARFLGVRQVAVPVSCNDAVDEFCRAGGIELVKTRIGSPHVIAALREAGWEGNGGFLTAATLAVPGGSSLAPLPTRDALLPLLCALLSSSSHDGLPRRFGGSAVIRDFSMEAAREIMKWLTPSDPTDRRGRVLTRRRHRPSRGWGRTSPRGGQLRWRTRSGGSARESAGISFPMADFPRSFGSTGWTGCACGSPRMTSLTSGRPGMPPRCASTRMRTPPNARRIIARLGVADDGILRRMARDASDRMAIASYRSSPRPLALFGALQHYAWGGYDLIPQLVGISNTERRPCAELWMGAHPRGLAQVEIDGNRMTLDRLLAADPWLTLGPDAALRFAGRLPYLFKVLDVRDMASIQAHPTRSQAEEGFSRENAAGVPIDAPQRLYRDENHKPEVHAVLTEFWMLHGFRPLEEIAEVLSLEQELAPLVAGFAEKLGASAAGDPNARTALLRELYERVMTMPQADVDSVLNPLVARLEADEAAGRLAKDNPGILGAARGADVFNPRRTPGPGDILDLPPESRAPAAGAGNVPAGGNPARVPRRSGHRAHGELRQCSEGRPYAEARGCARAAGNPFVP